MWRCISRLCCLLTPDGSPGYLAHTDKKTSHTRRRMIRSSPEYRIPASNSLPSGRIHSLSLQLKPTPRATQSEHFKSLKPYFLPLQFITGRDEVQGQNSHTAPTTTTMLEWWGWLHSAEHGQLSSARKSPP